MMFRSLFMAGLVLFPLFASAQTGPVSMRFLGGWRTDQGTQIAAFEFTLDPGWKTYWRAPGDAGIPPRISWSGAENIADARIRWPRPSVLDSGGLRVIGYVDRVVLPIEIVPAQPGLPVVAAGEIEIGVCRDLCIPTAFRFRKELPNPGDRDSRIAAALKRVPAIQDGASVGGLGCRVDPIADGLRVTARLPRPPALHPRAAVFEHEDREIWISAAELHADDEHLTVIAEFVAPDAQPFALDRSEISLTLIGTKRALEIRGCPAG